ncbi:AraC family transcriptional regulator [Brevibacillus sp. B_LB10_24]|uniref:AraC family transcriptional regulator n=1 Tax=Brevibacillus sp. B_LB10_24 TaxID=3380645 RepID=UPI0038BAB603
MHVWRNKPEIGIHLYSTTRQFVIEKNHYTSWKMIIPECGSLRFEIKNQTGIATFGDVVLFPPRISFRHEILSKLTFHSLFFTWFQPEDYTFDHQQYPFGKITLEDTVRLSTICDFFRESLLRKDVISQDWKNHLLHEILYQFFLKNQPKQFTRPALKNDRLIKQAVEFIEEHMSHPISIKSVSSLFGLSQGQFTRRFKEAYGVSPIEYLTLLRIKKAQVLLLNSNLTIDDIATRCGYQSGFYLSRIFSSKINITPSQYRKEHGSFIGFFHVAQP